MSDASDISDGSGERAKFDKTSDDYISLAVDPTRKRRQRISDACIVLGYLFAFLFVIVLLLGVFSAFFWGGMQFREAPKPTHAEYVKVIRNEFVWTLFHGLIFFAIPPAILLWCGYRLRQTETL